MSKTVRWFWNVLSGCLLVLVLSLGITKAVTGWSGVGPYRVFFIMSGSMEPEIHKHQLVLAKRLSVRETLVPGDIYAYKKRAWFGEKIVIHRLDEVLSDDKTPGHPLHPQNSGKRRDPFQLLQNHCPKHRRCFQSSCQLLHHK